MNEQGMTAVVTGASKGVGRATVVALVRDHACTVHAISRDGDALNGLVEELGDGIRPLVLDITATDAPTRIKEVLGGKRLHALVHNAGLLVRTDLGRYGKDVIERMYATNVHAPLLISQALSEELDGEPPGHVVHISSMGGVQDSVKFPGLIGYSSSKAAMVCMSQCLAEEWQERGIRSNCLALGAVDTEMLREAFPGYAAPVSAERMGAYVARFAMEGHELYNGKVLPVAVSTP